MKIIFYCQHVLGIGHFFRSLEICRELHDHEVILITGGPKPNVEIAGHIREVSMPTLMMTPDFSELFTPEKNISIEKVMSVRKKIILDLLEAENPDIFIVELYPFGRKAFQFEIDPALEYVRKNIRHPCFLICSLRDILVEKKDQEKYEKRVISVLNRHFDALLVHSDPDLISLDESFARLRDIKIPIVYTGFITSKPPEDAYRTIRRMLNIDPQKKLVVASAGGGKVGVRLLEATLEAGCLLKDKIDMHIEVFTGPFIDPEDFGRLKRLETRDFAVSRFTSNFLSYLAAADLSVSMAGYNTCMNILAAKTPAILWPFSQNREQRYRAERLAKKAPFAVLQDSDLTPDRLAFFIRKRLLQKEKSTAMVNLQGSTFTSEWINSLR